MDFLMCGRFTMRQIPACQLLPIPFILITFNQMLLMLNQVFKLENFAAFEYQDRVLKLSIYFIFFKKRRISKNNIYIGR